MEMDAFFIWLIIYGGIMVIALIIFTFWPDSRLMGDDERGE